MYLNFTWDKSDTSFKPADRDSMNKDLLYLGLLRNPNTLLKKKIHIFSIEQQTTDHLKGTKLITDTFAYIPN